MDDKTLKLAAGWIHRNRNTGYWTHLILVPGFSSHPDILKLRLSQDDASAVFAALETKGFLKKLDGEMLSIGQTQIQKYRLDYSLLKELKSFSEIPFYYYLPRAWIYYVEKYSTWLIVCFILIVTAFLQGFLEEAGRGLWLKVAGWMP